MPKVWQMAKKWVSWRAWYVCDGKKTTNPVVDLSQCRQNQGNNQRYDDNFCYDRHVYSGPIWSALADTVVLWQEGRERGVGQFEG